MNKVVALSLVSVFLLSILVGYLPVLTTQAATGNPQTYIVQINPPFQFAIVITGVDLGSDPGLIAYNLNQTLNNTKITITITDVTTGSVEYSFTGNFNTSPLIVPGGYDNALYSIVGKAVIIPVALNSNTKTTVSVAGLVATIQSALGIALVNNTVAYLVNVTAKKVYTNQTTTFVNAIGISGYVPNPPQGNPKYQTFYYNASHTTLTINNNNYNVWNDLIQTPANMQSNNLEFSISVYPKVGLSQTLAPTASAVLFAPIKIVSIYNQMMNNQPIGWGRSLINITVYNPLHQTNSWYLYQLTFTGPGLTNISFYPAIQIYSADQLANLKPALGLFSFTGPGKGVNAFNYTIILAVTDLADFNNNPPAPVNPDNGLPVYVYYNGGKTGEEYYITAWAQANLPYYEYTDQYTGQQNNEPVYLVAITFTNTPLVIQQNNLKQELFVYQVQDNHGNPVYLPVNFDNDNQPVYVPLYAVYVNSTAYAMQFGGVDNRQMVNGNNNPDYTHDIGLEWINNNIKPFNLTLTNSLSLKPFPVVTQLSTSAYEEFSGNTMNSIGSNQYSGMLFTTPPGSGAITGTYMITGNATIGNTYTNIYVTGFNTYAFKNMPTWTPSNPNPQGVGIGNPGGTPNKYYFSLLGTIGTPAYPDINGTTFYGVSVMAEVDTIGQVVNNQQQLTYVITDVFVSGFSATYNPQQAQQLVQIPGIGNGYLLFNTLSGDLAPTVNPNNLVYGQSVSVSNIPAVQIISASKQALTLPVSAQYFYIALVSLGLWTNNTIVYVTGYYQPQGQNQWYQMYGTSYFRAVIIPPSVVMSNVTPSSFVCNNGVWVDFKSPDDVLVTGYYKGTYAMQQLQQVNLNGQQIQATPFQAPGIGVNLVATGVMNGQVIDVGPVDINNLNYFIGNYLGLSNFTEQSNVPGGLNMSAVLPNNLPINWTTINGIGAPSVTVNTQNNQVQVVVPYVLPQYNPATLVPTPDFNVTVYLRYQFYQASETVNQNGVITTYNIRPGIYYGPQNTLIVITPPNLTVGTKVTLYFAAGDYAVQHYFPKNYWDKSVTITVPNATLTLKAPSVVPLYKLSVPLQVVEPYYAAPYPAQLQIGTNTVTLLANNYSFFGVMPSAGVVGVGKFINITVRFANGTSERIYLTGNNVSTLFQGGTLNENGSCTGAYNATISIGGLENLLHLTKVSQLNGSVLTISYYDNITHRTATVQIHFGAVSVIAPVMTQPALIFYILTAKYVNATFGAPVTLAQSVAVQPYVTLNDTFLAKAMAGVVANLYVTNVTIIDHYGNKYVIYYNSTNGSTNVMVNGKVRYAFKGDLLSTLPETAPNAGVFNGTPVTFVVNMPGTIYKNNTVFNGTLAVKLGNNVVTLGPATNFALPAYSFAGKLFGYNSTMYVTVADAASGSAVTLKTYIAAYNITPIRIAPVTTPVPIPANASTKVQYVYNQPITLTPTNQYIVIQITSVVNYSYTFYIATVVQPGKNSTTTAPVLINFQAVKVVPAIGPGIVVQLPVQISQISALGPGYYTITMFAVPFAGGPVISLYPAELVFTDVYVNTTVV